MKKSRANQRKEIIKALKNFRDERDWQQFHDSKNLATAISIEAAELNELFLWKTIKESEQVDKNRIKEELADVFAFCFLLADRHGFNVKDIFDVEVQLIQLFECYGRKNDPNFRFPWKLLATNGYGLWFDDILPPAPSNFNPYIALRIIGYDLKDSTAAVRSFKRHFLQDTTRRLNAVDTLVLSNLQRKYF